MSDLILAPKREASVERRHPWLMSGAVAKVLGRPASGDLVRVLSSQGEVIAAGHYSPQSQIRVRLVAFGKDEVARLAAGDAELIEARIRAAIERRSSSPLLRGTDALRLINGEGDGLPGLVVDRYGTCAVVKLTSAGMAERRAMISEVLRECSEAVSGFERSDAFSARKEGLAVHQGVLWGPEPPELIEIDELGRKVAVDIRDGQKTGFYLDQRDARSLAGRLAEDARVLDLFSYTGAFSVAAARGGARSVTLVDGSAPALARAESNLALNGAAAKVETHKDDAFRFLRSCAERYDLLIVDPPPLARHKGDVTRASRAYKDLLLHAFRAAAPGAHLLAFACSQHISPDLFAKIAFGAALDARRGVQRLATLGAAPDHPVSLYHPEGRYLTGLHLQV